MNKKLKAFTLIDLLGALLLSSIVIGGAYSLFTYIRERQFSIQQSNITTYNVQQLHEKINYLFFHADSIESKSDSYLIHFGQNLITIDFESEGIILDDGKSDTLFCIINESAFTAIPNTNFIKTIHVNFDFDGLPFDWYFYKNYGNLNVYPSSEN